MIGLLSVSLALADERDEDVFGAPTEVPPEEPAEAPPAEPPPAEPPPGDSADMLQVLTTDADIAGKLQTRDDALTIGGRVYLRTDASLVEEATDVGLSSPNLAELFADARPNDRVRATVRGRIEHDWTVLPDTVDPFTGEPVQATKAVLDQLNVKTDVARLLYVTVGQQHVKWGAGRFWNPTDFLNQQRRDPLAVFDLRTGVGLLKFHLPVEKAGLNFYAIANLDGATVAGDLGGAGRVEWLVGQTEVSASVAARDGTPLRLGADVSSGIWLVDLHLEGAVQHGEGTRFWEGTLDYDAFSFPTELDRSDEWIPQVVAGLSFDVRYNDRDALSVGGEFFYNGAGYDDADLYDWLFFNGDFDPLYVGRMYAGGYAWLPAPGRWDDVTFIASYLTNLSDGSGIARLDYRHLLLTHLQLVANVSAHPGKVGEFRYGTTVPAVPGVTDEEIIVDPPLLELGLGAVVSF